MLICTVSSWSHTSSDSRALFRFPEFYSLTHSDIQLSNRRPHPFLKKLENWFSYSSVMDEETGNSVQDAEYYPREKYGAANLYAAKKTVAQGMMDVALITANANQLRFVVEYNQSSPTYAIAISLITISLFLQIVVGICLIFKGRCDLKGEKKFKQANTVNNYIVVGVFIITIVNVFVAAFSTGPPPLTKTSE